MTDNEHVKRLSIDWSDDTCSICNEETWLSMILYEPIDVEIDEDDDEKSYIAKHPAPRDEHAILVCSSCEHESQEQLAEVLNVDKLEVPYFSVKQYLTYRIYPEFVEQIYPEEAETFEKATNL